MLPQPGAGLSGSQVPLVEVELLDDELLDDELLDDELDEELLDDELLLLGEQAPFMHSSPSVQTTPQEPQWALLNMMSTQIPPQSISVAAQPVVPELVELAPPVPVEVEAPVPLLVVELLVPP